MRQDGKRGGTDRKQGGTDPDDDVGEVDFDLTSEVHSLDDPLTGLEELADDSTQTGSPLSETRVARHAPEVDLSGADDSGDGFFLFGDEDAASGKSDLERAVAGSKAGALSGGLESTVAIGDATLPFGLGPDDDDMDKILESTVALPQHALPVPGRTSGPAVQPPADVPSDLSLLDFDLGTEGPGTAEATTPGAAPSPVVEAAAAAAVAGGAAVSRIEAAMARAGSSEVHPQHVLEPEAAPTEAPASRAEPAAEGSPQKVRIRVPLKPKEQDASAEPEITTGAPPPTLTEIEDEEEEAAALQPHWPRIIGLGAGALLLLWLLSGLFRSGGNETAPSAEQPPPSAATPAEEPTAAPSPSVAEESAVKPEPPAAAPEEKPPALTAAAPEPVPAEPVKPEAVAEPVKPEAAPSQAPQAAEHAERPKSKPAVPEEAAASGAAGTYTIRAGDTYRGIARRRLGNSSHWYALVKANPGVDQTRLRVGQVINLPDPGTSSRDRKEQIEQAREAVSGGGTGRTVTIHPGDDLSKIARRVYGKSSAWRLIYDANRDKLSSPRGLKVGTELQIPARSGEH